MTSAFAQGMQFGRSIYDDAERSKLQRQEQARLDEIHARRKLGWEREDAQFAEENNARIGLENLVRNGVMATSGSGFSPESAALLHSAGGTTAVDEAASYANVENRRFGLPTQNTTGATTSRAASPLEMNLAEQRWALAARDRNAYRQLRAERGQLEEDAVLRAAGTEAPDMDLVRKWTNVKNGRLTLGKPDKDGFVQFSIVRPDGDATFATLTPVDAQRLYMGAKLLQHNPTRGLEMIAAVNKEIAAAAKEQFTQEMDVAKANNAVAGDRATVGVRRAELSVSQQRLALSREEAKRRADFEKMGAVRQYVDDQGNVREFYPTMTKNGIEWTEFARPPGLKPYNPKKSAGPVREVPTEGTLLQEGDGPAFKADGRGGRMAADAIEPSKRDKALAQMGFNKSDIEQLPWTPDGRYVAWGGMGWDPRSPQDMAELKRAMDQHAADSVMAIEAEKRGFAPRYPRGTAGSLDIRTGAPFVDPNDWAVRRQSQLSR